MFGITSIPLKTPKSVRLSSEAISVIQNKKEVLTKIKKVCTHELVCLYACYIMRNVIIAKLFTASHCRNLTKSALTDVSIGMEYSQVVEEVLWRLRNPLDGYGLVPFPPVFAPLHNNVAAL